MMNNKVHIGDSSPAAQQAWGDSISTYREDRTLPTCRLNYITNHPTTQLANLHADESMIAPAWCKISKSVWESSSILYGGYGRRLQRSSISKDAPTYFNNPAVQYNTDVPPPGRKATITRPTNRVFVENESAYVLPGGKSILSATTRSKNIQAGYSRRQLSRQYPHGNQTLLEHLNPSQDGRRTPLDWNSSTARDSFGDDACYKAGAPNNYNNNNSRASTAPNSRRSESSAR